jgi:hypothetical protein
MRSVQRSGRTKKPCPGCGCVVQYRRADEICSKCKRDIKENTERRQREEEEQTAARGGVAVRALVKFPLFYELPKFPNAYNRQWLSDQKQPRDQFQVSFLELAALVGEKASSATQVNDVLIPGSSVSYRESNGYFLPVAVVNLLRQLHGLVKEMVDAAYASGEEVIRNLFQRVVSGDIEFNRFAERMELDPEEITSRIVFASAPGAAPARLLLCEVGQVDAKGQAVTQERLDEIEKLYTGMGVAIERQGNQLWTKLREEKKEESQ